jgi:L-arabinokinase
MPCAAAAAAGIPAVVCANFTWDWIYAAYEGAAPGVAELVEVIEQTYGFAEAAWRLPMHGGFESFERIVDVPFVARHSRGDLTREQIRAILGLSPDRRLALVSFGGYGVRDLPLDRLDCTGSWGIVLTAPGIHLDGLPDGVHGVAEELIYGRGLHYEDVVRAVDVVVTKPGYGIISDCLANGAAMLYTPRGRFAEYDVMVRELPKYLRCGHLTLEDFGAGRWKDGLDAVERQAAPPDRVATNGAEVIARLILARLGA